MFVFSTPLIFAGIGGMFSERSGVVNIGLEGMMLMGAFLGVYGADKGGSWVVGRRSPRCSPAGSLALVHAYFSIHLRADQIVSGVAVNFLALGITGYFFFDLYNGEDVPRGVSTIPDVAIPYVEDWKFLGPAIGDLNLMVWLSFLLVIVSYVVIFKTPIGLRIRACGEHPRAADTVGINVYAVRYGSVVLSGILAGLGGAYLSIGFGGGSFTDNMTAGRGFIALAAMIFGAWRPFGTFYAALLFGFSTALAYRLDVYSPGRDALPDPAVRPHADRRRRRHRPHRPACRRRQAVCQAVGRRRGPRRSRSSSGSLALAGDPGRGRVAARPARPGDPPGGDRGRADRVRARPDRGLALAPGAPARRAQRAARGERLVRAARLVAWSGVYVAVTGGLALAFYGVLRASS